MFKKKILAASVALAALGFVGSAQADVFQFNPNGGGSGLINGAAVFDEAPGNVLAIGGTPAGGLQAPTATTPGTTVTDLYQANLSTVLGTTSNVLFANGTDGTSPGKFFTIVAGFSETVTSCSAGVIGGCSNATFGINPGGFFKIYATSALGNDLAGTGFTTGTSILSGHLLSGTSSTVVTSLAGGNLDQSPNGNGRGATQTVASIGTANLTLQIDSVVAGYFPDLFSGGMLVISLTNTSLVTPFGQVDPSFLFSSNGTANGDTADNIGLVNGISGPNFQFQADANSSFLRSPVPEPGMLALLGLGLAGMGAVSRKRRK